MSESDDILASIPKLQDAKDATSLVALRDHADKRVRKAVRKALHALKSKGVEIPDSAPKGWSVGSALEGMRGEMTAVGVVDTRTVPGALRFMLTEPNPGSGATLFAGTIGPDDRVLEFNVYSQTDGQRARMVRDWERRVGDRRVPPEWLKGRIRFARDATIAAGFSVPPALNQSLSRLGDTPEERPTNFVTGLADEPAFDPEKDIDDLLQKAGVQQWPPLLDLEGTLTKAAEIHGDAPQPTEDAERVKLLMKSVEGDEDVRKALAGTLANTLSDTAIHLWLEDDRAGARKVLDMVQTLQTHDAPESLEWVARLLGFQVASLLRVVQQQQAQQARGAQTA